ncbi:VOC family protein [Sphingopyxis sp.]|jgi:hypothetical protein|uniref:VOC family protein n=1 Tax=Sphingopyxis sp. TaxID=1908224 RepID=UPI002DEE0BC0|nr:VOC family protein [Sphingopyxis sp.]
MTEIAKATALGEIMQMAFVPQDFEASLQYWLKMGAGPFFVLLDKTSDWCRAYGESIDLTLDVALGNWGDMQIEIIRQKSDARTIYSDWRARGKEGVHHVCIVVGDFAAARRQCIDNGFTLLHEAGYRGAEWAYFDTHGGDGTMLEIVCSAPGSLGMSTVTREAARDWDGSDPVRYL